VVKNGCASWLPLNLINDVLQTFRAHESELRLLGRSHAAVFGSVARGDANAGSDIDVLVELDDSRSIGDL
jgi:predicted nucleotidyltransferase